MEIQPHVGIVEVETRDLGDPVQAISQRIPVDFQFFGGQGRIAVIGEIGIQCVEQIAVLLLVIGDQIGQPGHAEPLQFAGILQGEQ